MKPTPGDIYCVFHPQLQQYVACQVTALKDSRLVAVLELDWSGDALPDAAGLVAMRPLICDFSSGANISTTVSCPPASRPITLTSGTSLRW